MYQTEGLSSWRGEFCLLKVLEQWHEHRAFVIAFAVGLAFFLVLRSKQFRSRQVEFLQPWKQQTNHEAKTEAHSELGHHRGQHRFSKPQVYDASAFEDATTLKTSNHRQRPLRRVVGARKPKRNPLGLETETFTIAPHVFYSSLQGSTEVKSKELIEKLCSGALVASSQILKPQLHDLSYIDYDEYFLSIPTNPQSPRATPFYLILVPSYNIDTILNTFLAHLDEIHHDFRIDTAPLAALAGYSVFGFGDREGWPREEEGFCFQAREVDKWMAKLTGRKRAYPLGMGDVKSDANQRLDEWVQGVETTMISITKQGSLGEGILGSGDPLESEDEEGADEPEYEASAKAAEDFSAKRSRNRPRAKKNVSGVEDLEDLGRQISDINRTANTIPIDFTSGGLSSTSTQDPKPMVPKSSPTYTALTKQGYTIIGSHSGVKICRWTKSALRGRGSCYKHSFYGIASHLCMETTPSLSCSNKCVFCWRHGTNPVGTTWRWQVDPPQMIFEGAKAGHLQKIKAMRGVPGVRAERFEEAQRIRHCALSLVGEPIFYPHINEFVDLLHKDRISSFLVCNAQHPEHLARLKQVTQLYVSIDASNREDLRKIDRPLHRDFWERFLRCLDILRERRSEMRTVFRLTLVKGFNLDKEAEGYADLVAQALPCFVEIKGVTYCGTSTSASAGLTMQNVPFWHEVQAFVLALDASLQRRGLDYGIAAEHSHSCCALIASKTFLREGRWHTNIDYERFFDLLDAGKSFGPADYIGKPTPEWALWTRGGFDPSDERVDRKGRKLE